jgi:hypothetical protein
MSVIRKISGIFLALFASAMSLDEFFSIIDPAGSKMTDDSDPFGMPPSVEEHAMYIFAIVAIYTLAYFLLRKKKYS